jgi:hypothetical protein
LFDLSQTFCTIFWHVALSLSSPYTPCQLAVSFNGRNIFCPWTSNYTTNSSNVSATAHHLILWIASDWLATASSLGCYPYYKFCPIMKNRVLD